MTTPSTRELTNEDRLLIVRALEHYRAHQDRVLTPLGSPGRREANRAGVLRDMVADAAAVNLIHTPHGTR